MALRKAISKLMNFLNPDAMTFDGQIRVDSGKLQYRDASTDYVAIVGDADMQAGLDNANGLTGANPAATIADLPSAGQVVVGSYVGTSPTPKTISGLGFAPSAINIFGINVNGQMFCHKNMAAGQFMNESGESTLDTGKWGDITGDGFTTGASSDYNNNGSSYAYIIYS